MFRKITDGFEDFSKSLSPKDKKFYSKLAEGQNPEALLIACSDSRLVPHLFTQTHPGDLFMVRNVGNLVPKANEKGRSTGDQSELAALEYGVNFLNIKNIIVCGHSQCGAMKTLKAGVEKLDTNETPNLSAWLANAQDTAEGFHYDETQSEDWDELSQLSQYNVIRQLEHLKSYEFIRQKLDDQELTLHGWFFAISSATLYVYQEEKNKFISLIEENE